MRSSKSVVDPGGSQQELRCPRCGNQYIRTQLIVDDEPFDIDPFINYCRSQNTRSSVQTTEIEVNGTDSARSPR
ncbi:MAG: hypothetical protein AAF420_06555 [Pseudomonadota bacterium]